MDVSALVVSRLGLPRHPPAGDEVAAVLGWLPLQTDDGKPLTWTRTDAVRLLFYRRLRREGRLTG
jgi:hypothetical protein